MQSGFDSLLPLLRPELRDPAPDEPLRGVAQDGKNRGRDIGQPETTIQAEDEVKAPLRDLPKLGLVLSQLRLVPLPLDSAGDLDSHEGEEVLLLFPVTDPRVVALHDQGSDDLVLNGKGGSEPVDSGSPMGFDLPAPLQSEADVGIGKKGLPCPDHVLRQAPGSLSRRGRVVVLIDEIGEVEPLSLGIVEGDIEVLNRHQLADDGVNPGEESLQVFRLRRGLGEVVEAETDPLGHDPFVRFEEDEEGFPVCRKGVDFTEGASHAPSVTAALHPSTPAAPRDRLSKGETRKVEREIPTHRFRGGELEDPFCFRPPLLDDPLGVYD